MTGGQGRAAAVEGVGEAPEAAAVHCTAEKHNATTWRAKTCRCDEGRDDHNRKARIARKERELGRPRRVPAAPFQRQVRDLMAAGWPAREIAPRIGWKCGELHTLFGRRWVNRKTAAAIDSVWSALCTERGPSEMTRRRAARADLWLPAAVGDAGDPDPMAVLRAVDGDPPDALTAAERREAVRHLHARGFSYAEIAERTHVDVRTVHRDLTALGLVKASPQSVDGGVNADLMTHAEHMSNDNASGVA